MHVRLGSTDSPQDHVVVCVVSHVPDRYVLEQMTVCVHDVAGPGAHNLATPADGPYVENLQPRLVTWEELASHVLQVFFFQVHCNPLVLVLALWCGQVGVEISKHEQCTPPRAVCRWP